MTTTNGQPVPDSDRVDPCFACSHCGEDRLDYLVWLDDRRVECTSCGHVYEPD